MMTQQNPHQQFYVNPYTGEVKTTPQHHAQYPQQFAQHYQHGMHPQPARPPGLIARMGPVGLAAAITFAWFVLAALGMAVRASKGALMFVGVFGSLAFIGMIVAWLFVLVSAIRSASAAQAERAALVRAEHSHQVQPAYPMYTPQPAPVQQAVAAPASDPEQEWMRHVATPAHDSDQEW